MREHGVSYTAARALVAPDDAPSHATDGKGRVMREVRIGAVLTQWSDEQRESFRERGMTEDICAVHLDEIHGQRRFEMLLGRPAAIAIAMAAREVVAPRPMTHDLFIDALVALGSRATAARVTRVDGTTFFAELDLETSDGTATVDARPSDAIAIALRAGAPIFVADELLMEATAAPT